MQDDFSRAEKVSDLTIPLSKPLSGETLYLYLTVSESVVSVAIVWEDKGVQKPVYYTATP